MRTPQRFLTDKPDTFQVVGLSFKPETTTLNQTENNVKIAFKIGDLDKPIDFIPYFQTNERAHCN
jgi:hypothetical protein